MKQFINSRGTIITQIRESECCRFVFTKFEYKTGLISFKWLWKNHRLFQNYFHLDVET